jgi:hypothetical protein
MKMLSWMLFLLAVGGGLYMVWIFGWLIFYPAIDPLPVVLAMCLRLIPLFLAIGLTGIGYIVCRAFRI